MTWIEVYRSITFALAACMLTISVGELHHAWQNREDYNIMRWVGRGGQLLYVLAGSAYSISVHSTVFIWWVTPIIAPSLAILLVGYAISPVRSSDHSEERHLQLWDRNPEREGG